jgi:hypothetical protein
MDVSGHYVAEGNEFRGDEVRPVDSDGADGKAGSGRLFGHPRPGLCRGGGASRAGHAP